MVNKFRWWLVKKLASDRPVILNVSIVVVDNVLSNGKEGLIHGSNIKIVEGEDKNEDTSDDA